MQNLLNDLKALLEQDQRLIGNEGTLLKNKVIELALSMDQKLIKLLLTHKNLRKHFFTEVDQILVFDKVKFQEFVSNKAFLPDSYTTYKNKIGLTVDEQYLTDSKEVVLSWPYKDCVLEGGQTKDEARREEIFWNETLAPDQIDRLLSPKVLTNFKKFDKDGEHEVQQITGDENLIIKGNNLLALHTLKKQYAGKVKLIYIDPPYNTGSDSFNYNDNFNHSTWLTFMKNRLDISKRLLTENGFFCIQCSFHEYAYLKVICDEILGEKCWRTTINILARHPDRTLTGDKEFNDVIEYLLIYSQNINQRLPFIESEKLEDDYIYSIELLDNTHQNLEFDNKIIEVYLPTQYKINKHPPTRNGLKNISIRGSIREKNSSGRFFVKHLENLVDKYPPLTLFKVPEMGDDAFNFRYFSLPKQGNKNGSYFQGMPQSSNITYKPYPNFVDFIEEYNIVNFEGGSEFRNGKKPEDLLFYFINMLTNQGDLIADFCLGSGTTAAVAHKMGRRYIGIEQMDYINTITVPRLQKVIDGEPGGISKSVNWQGGGSFVYCELKEANQCFVDKIQEAITNEELIAIWASMQETAFLSYQIDPKTINLSDSDFTNLNLDEQKRFLIEILDKNMLYVPLSEIEDETYSISEKDKKLNDQFQNRI